MGKMSKKVNSEEIKKYAVIIFVLIGVLFLSITWLFRSGSGDGTDKKSEENGEELVIEDDRDKLIIEKEQEEQVEEVDQEPEDVNESSREDARENLQQPEEPLDEIDDDERLQLNADLSELFAVYKKDHGFDGNFYASDEFYTTIASGTDVAMSRQIDTAIKIVGYEADIESAEWYGTEVDNVYQFLVSLKKEGYDDLVFSGNYNNSDRVFHVAKMDGILDLDEFAS